LYSWLSPFLASHEFVISDSIGKVLIFPTFLYFAF